MLGSYDIICATFCVDNVAITISRIDIHNVCTCAQIERISTRTDGDFVDLVATSYGHTIVIKETFNNN